jgi:hypothetical protein
MNQDSIIRFIADNCIGVDVVQAQEGNAPEIAWGDTFFIYDPQRNLEAKRRMPFATIVTKDYGEFDCASKLNRPGVFRLNIGITKETYAALFGGSSSDGAHTGHDFAALDKLMPHPVYASQGWVCILNPSDATFEAVKPLLREAYDLVVQRFAKFAHGDKS